MSDFRCTVVTEARSWIGTPYQHQMSSKGAGCDCLGLIRGVWRAIHDREPAVISAYTPDWSEASKTEELWHAARLYLLPSEGEKAELGDVLLFRMRPGAVAKHLGIVTDIGPGWPKFTHAFSGHGVVENSLSTGWEKRIVARFAFPQSLSQE